MPLNAYRVPRTSKRDYCYNSSKVLANFSIQKSAIVIKLEISNRNNLIILLCLFLLSFLILVYVPPIPQWDSYHNFADARSFLKIPNFANVISNIGFLAVGSFGLVKIYQKGCFESSIDRVPYILFFLSVMFIGMGSSYYHWEPSNGSLFWDRLPMTTAFMSLFAAVISDRINRTLAIYIVLPILLIAGIYSLIYWQQTEATGFGDLRFYGMVQFFPLVAIPLIFWLYRAYRYTSSQPVLWVFVWYACAKLLEHFDHEVYNLLGKMVSGHTLKHLAATIAILYIVKMIAFSKTRNEG